MVMYEATNGRDKGRVGKGFKRQAIWGDPVDLISLSNFAEMSSP